MTDKAIHFEPTPIPSLGHLNVILRLDVKSGALYWRERPAEYFRSSNSWKRFNNLFAGTRADHKATYRDYRRIQILQPTGRRSWFQAHRIIWKMVHGVDPVMEIDHIDRNPANNRPENLRDVSRTDNVKNSEVCRKNPTGKIGVYSGTNGKFWAQIRHDGKCRYLGVFSTVGEASAAVAKVRASA